MCLASCPRVAYSTASALNACTASALCAGPSAHSSLGLRAISPAHLPSAQSFVSASSLALLSHPSFLATAASLLPGSPPRNVGAPPPSLTLHSTLRWWSSLPSSDGCPTPTAGEAVSGSWASLALYLRWFGRRPYTT